MEYSSTTPYMIRAIHEWCVDNGLTPHLLVAVNGQTRVPVAYVKDNEIVLNLSYGATRDMQIENDYVSFSARFGGVSQNLYIPTNAVKGIFAKETGQGMFFEVVEDATEDGAESVESSLESVELSKPAPFEVVENNAKKPPQNSEQQKKSKKPTLKVVK